MNRKSWLLAALLCLSLIYLWRFVDRGWIPHDDGMLAQIAERVLAGELPHRDFDDPYTGLLGYLHGLGFLILGPSLRSIRLVLFAFTVAWLPAIYLVTRRFVPPLGAVLVTALALTWSVPNYFAGLPSYYNVFFATFGMLALVRHVETDRRVWLVLAGVWGGLSFLIKSAGGIYFAAAALLFLVYRERATWHDNRDELGQISRTERVRSAKRVTPFLVAKALGATLVAIGLARFSPHLGPMELLHFVLPGTVVALLIWHDEISVSTGSMAQRAGRLQSLVWPFGVGFALPVLLFLVPYIRSGALEDFLTGVFVLPARRFEIATFAMPPLRTVWSALPYGAVLLFASARARGLPIKWPIAAVIAALPLALVAAARSQPMYEIVWHSARHIGFFAVAAGCLLLLSRADLDANKRQFVFLAVAMAAFMPLLQIPFPAPIYFAYGAPFLVLAVSAVAARARAGPLHGALGVAYLLFAIIWMNSSYIWALGNGYAPFQFVDAPWVRRAQIRMDPGERDEYTRLMQVVVYKMPSHSKMLALPDCPEVDFLAARRNPSRYIYESLSEHPPGSREVIELLDAKDIALIVINREPSFSPRLDADLLRALEARYPYSEEAGRFLVRWRL